MKCDNRVGFYGRVYPPGHTRIPTGPTTIHQGSRRQKTSAHCDVDGDGGSDDDVVDDDEKKAVDGRNNRN